MDTINSSYEIHIKGLVQGVGFRPFIYRLAQENDLKGWVENRNSGVIVKISAAREVVEKFVRAIRENAPLAAEIKQVEIVNAEKEDLEDFSIRESKNESEEITEISPDIAICYDCLEDMKMQPRRINYPFTNCTNCGPRFTIIKDLPYDRQNTSMSVFKMCDDCYQEYHDIEDRRFHAQPISCNFCGPQYELYDRVRITKDIFRITREVKKLLYKGRIIAVKGMGGFHLMCDATNATTVQKLRELKGRDKKPFALMFPNFEEIKNYASVSEWEKELLLSWQRPIVLLEQKRILNKAINRGLNKIGVMLPYMPFHFLLFEEIDLPAVVLTSANPSNEPIIKDNQQAFKKLGSVADAFLVYNRDIINRTDDSVVQMAEGNKQIIRRSRGFVPTPIDLNFDASGILATGGELKNTFALGKNKQAILSQHIGDLKNLETYDFYADTISQFLKLFRSEVNFIVSDMHPDYMSTKYARNFLARQSSQHSNGNGKRAKWVKVQHHHAHIASCMAERGLDERVIGVALDGTGFGDDEKIWGGEFFICDLKDYERFAHFEYMPMPGGDKAVITPWRMALSYLNHAFAGSFDYQRLEMLRGKPDEDIKLILSMIRKNINSPFCSSAGRLFDAVSALLNLCAENCYDAEAPMKLEAIVDESVTTNYSFDFRQNIVSFSRTFQEIVDDLQAKNDRSMISAKFHNTVIQAILKVSERIREETGLNKVVLSGGTFQNKFLLKRSLALLKRNKFNVFTNELVPPNDGGISLGQLAIAAKKFI